MPGLKTKNNFENTIKKLDKTAIVRKNLKENIATIKDKTKVYSSYNNDESTEREYAEDKMKNSIEEIKYYMPIFNKKGKQSIEKTKENIIKYKEKIKKVQEVKKDIKAKKQVIIKRTNANVKTAKNSIKSEKITVKTAEETTKIAINTTKQVAKNSPKIAQRTAQMIKQTIQNTISTIKVATKTIITVIKGIIATTKALVSAIIAGGWVAVVIIIVICLIALICCSPYGIFFSNESEVGSTMSSVIREINADFTNKITEIQKNNAHDEYTINSNRAEWKDILSVYTVLVSNGNEVTNVATLDEYKIEQLKDIFWDMNIIEYDVEEIEKEIETTDEKGNPKIEKVKSRVLHINISKKSIEQMVLEYNLNEEQILQIAQLQREEYNSVWKYVVYGSSVGSADIVNVAVSQIGNVGGQPYWSWYGFKSRVEWCACFVSWCANEYGYIDAGIIPKYAGCEAEGVAWFKTCGLWQERGYEAKAGDIIFFDWADSNDGKADHTGIVEKTENGKVYTIEGNSGDTCCRQQYDINSGVILGYGTPMY